MYTQRKLAHSHNGIHVRAITIPNLGFGSDTHSQIENSHNGIGHMGGRGYVSGRPPHGTILVPTPSLEHDSDLKLV